MIEASQEDNAGKLMKAAKVACAIGLLIAGAAMIYRANSAAADYPDGPEDRELFICQKDGTIFERTPRELYDASRKAGGLELGTTICPTCGQPEGRRAQRTNGKAVAMPKTDFERTFQPSGNKG